MNAVLRLLCRIGDLILGGPVTVDVAARLAPFVDTDHRRNTP